MKVRAVYSDGKTIDFVFNEDVLCIDMITKLAAHGTVKRLEFL